MREEVVQMEASTVLGGPMVQQQHLAPPTPRQWSAAVGGYRLQLPWFGDQLGLDGGAFSKKHDGSTVGSCLRHRTAAGDLPTPKEK